MENESIMNQRRGRWTRKAVLSVLAALACLLALPAQAAISDFNGDGKSDILMRNTNGSLSLWLMNDATITSSTVLNNGVPVTGWTIAGVGDFNGDGKPDILWRGPNGEVALWLMNGSTVLSGNVIATIPLTWTIAGVGDFNGDGKADILWRGPGGEDALWLMNGSTQLSAPIFANTPTTWTVAGVGDFNGDGKPDILWRGPNGEVAIWLMNGTTVLSGPVIATIPLPWTIVGVGDFNGDGNADILWRGPNGEVAIWLMNGTTELSGPVIATIPLDWTIAGVGDFNGDGKADIRWQHTTGTTVDNNALWFMNGTSAISGLVISTTPQPILPANVYYLYPDQLGTPRLVTDSSNNVVWRNLPISEPFGNGAVENNPSGAGPFIFNLRFKGQYADIETGLSYNGARYYDPATGRFPQSDQIGLNGGSYSTYLYARANPLSYTDASGNCPWCLAGALIGGGLDLGAQYLKNGSFNNLDYTELALATASGAIGGGLGAQIGKMTTSLLANTLLNGGIGALTGAASTAAHNALTCSNVSVGKGALVGGAFGAMGGYLGTAAGNWIGEAGAAGQSAFNSAVDTLMPSLAPFSGSAIQGTATAVGSATSNAVGNTAAGMSPFYGN